MLFTVTFSLLNVNNLGTIGDFFESIEETTSPFLFVSSLSEEIEKLCLKTPSPKH